MYQLAPSESRIHKKALVVDDNAVCRTMHALALTSLGYVVTTACDGLAGVTAVQLGTFDIITMDVRMPVMNGFECTRQIRLMENSGISRATIIGVSSSDAEQECFKAGMDAFTKKPLNRNFLRAILGHVAAPSRP